MMKTMLLSIILGLLLVFLANADFLPEDNSDAFGLEYGESIAGFIPNAPKIDGKLDDWKYAIWVAFDSEDELLRGQGAWEGKDDLTMTWSTMYDAKTFYFAAAVRDDIFAPAANAGQPWGGDTIFLYIDWEKVGVGQPVCKPNFAYIGKKALVTDFSAVKNPDLPKSDIAIMPTPELGKGGMIYEVAMPFTSLTKVKVKEGTEIGFTPGYEEGTDDPEKKGGLVFMDWHGLNPDDSANLGTLTFGEPLAVDPTSKLTLTWGQLKKIAP